MKNKLIILSFTLTFIINAKEFEQVAILNWNKENISSKHLLFSHPDKKRVSIHLQVGERSAPWSQETVVAEVEEMARLRNKMGSMVGLNDYVITSSKLTHEGSNQVLDLAGSYVRLGNEKIYFKERNFYHEENTIQIRILASDSKELDSLMKMAESSVQPFLIDLMP